MMTIFRYRYHYYLQFGLRHLVFPIDGRLRSSPKKYLRYP